MPIRRSIQDAVSHLQASVLYTAVIAFLAVGSVLLLAAELLYEDRYPEFIPLSHRLDIAIAWIFLTDFFAGLIFNTRESFRSYWRHNWLNLVSSIPISSEVTRTLRVLRLFRALRVIRGSMNFWFAHRRLVRNRGRVREEHY